jgi:hypothetical protein
LLLARFVQFDAYQVVIVQNQNTSNVLVLVGTFELPKRQPALLGMGMPHLIKISVNSIVIKTPSISHKIKIIT